MGRAHDLRLSAYRRSASVYLLERLFGGDAAVPQPDPVGPVLLRFDPFEEVPQGDVVCGIAVGGLLSGHG